MKHWLGRGAIFAGLISLLSGCATTGTADPRDPLEGFNRGVYSVNKTLDTAIFDPVGKVYKFITPEIVDEGITNIFSNLGDVAVVANDILQFKINQAFMDVSRIIFNSTAGIGGFFDVATPIALPKHHEDFGQTLATWGIGPGPYLVVPLFGPSTIRDSIGFAADSFLNPVMYVNDTMTRAGLLTMNYIDFKSDLHATRNLVEDASIDEYEFVKNAYFEKRQSLINDGEQKTDYSTDF